MIIIRARNKIIEGKYKEFQFKTKRGQLYLCCLEREIALNRMLVYSVQELSYTEQPRTISMLARGYLGNMILGQIGMITGMLTANRQGIHRLRVLFSDGEEAIAEVDDGIFNKMMLL